ncbi:MAG: O-methyltransferase [Candidatus Cryptobacteroides sp.]
MDAMTDYIMSHSTGETPALQWIRKQTFLRTNHARMLSGAIQGQFLSMAVKMLKAHNVLELGTFTGYSAVCLAYGLEESGHLDTLEVNDELEDVILEGFSRAGVDGKISLHIGDAKETLISLKEQRTELYDLVYIDANKREYCEYYDLVFDMVRRGGFILADNVLWDGKVYENPMPQDKQTVGIAKFNDMVVADPRVESVILPLRDGLNVIMKR